MCHILLVSGGGKKKAFNTVTALQQLAASKRQKLLSSQAVGSHNSLEQLQQERTSSSVTGGSAGQPLSAPGCLLEQVTKASSRKRSAAAGPDMASNLSGSSSCGDQQLPSLAVAFNPYLPDEGDEQVERSRLREKLATGLVDRIYLQVIAKCSGAASLMLLCSV
jgi:hypothetical protein